MRHIHQIGTEGKTYTYIETDMEDLENHLAMMNHSDLFEIVDGMPPEGSQILIFVPPDDPD